MQRILALVSSTAALAAVAVAQCPQGTTAGLVKWSSTAGYAATQTLDDESITNPPLTLTPPFNMPGAVGTLDQLWINSNGEFYFTDSTLALTQPAFGASFGINSLAEMRGTQAGASARIAVLGGDHQGSVVAGASWDVSVDQSVAGQTTVTWFDMRRFGNGTDRFSFSATLFHASGVVTMNYGSTFPLPATGFTGRFVGVSIGNGVGTTTSPNSDLSATPSSGTVGLLYQSFTGTAPNVFDLAGQTLTISPNGTGGYDAAALVPYVAPTCAFTSTYGSGCYAIGNSAYQVYVDSPAAKAALDGNAMQVTNSATAYSLAWLPGGGGAGNFVNNGGQVPLVFADVDDGNVAYTPAFGPIPVPGGTAATINVSVNGILTMAAAANNNLDFSPSAADITNNTTAPATAIYGYWRDMLLDDTPPAVNGTITTEEVGNMLYISWNAVECYNTALANPSTFQFQVNMTTGDVKVVWVTLDNSPNTSDTAVGASLAGAGATPGAVTLATGLPLTLDLTATANPLTLSVSGRPVITLGGTGPSLPVTITGTNIPDAAPPAAIALGFLVFSLGQLPSGIDLGPAGLNVGAPGCRLYIPSFDVILGFPSTTIGTQVLFSGAIPQPLSPGLNFYAQALSLIVPNSLPGGLNDFGAVWSNGIQLNFQLQ